MKTPWTLCGVVAVSTISLFIISFAGGRAGMPVSIFALPAQIIPFLVNVSCVGTLILLLLLSAAKKKPQGGARMALLLSTLFAAGGFMIPPSQLFRIGFRARVKATVSTEELRQIARVFQENAPTNEILPGPGKRSLWTEQEHRAIWTKMTNSTSLGKLDDWVVLSQSPDSVELSWGGALVGHWGVCIKNDPAISAGDIAPGIATFDSD